MIANRLDRGVTRSARIRLLMVTNPLVVLSAAILTLLAVMAVAAPWILTLLELDPNATDLFNIKAPPGTGHPLGTDEAGRDVLARLILGSRTSLIVGMTAAIASAAIGTIIGLWAGYFGGRLDSMLMRLTDGVIALPFLPLLIVLSAIDYSKVGLGFLMEGSGLMRIVLIVSLVAWPTVARLVRAETMSIKARDFVTAARAQGATPFMIMRRHILPNVQATIVVATTLSIGNVILLESVLSFLGLGIRPPTPSWGNMLTNAQSYLWDSPELAFWPGMAIFVTVIAFNFLGDGLQDALNPKRRL